MHHKDLWSRLSKVALLGGALIALSWAIFKGFHLFWSRMVGQGLSTVMVNGPIVPFFMQVIFWAYLILLAISWLFPFIIVAVKTERNKLPRWASAILFLNGILNIAIPLGIFSLYLGIQTLPDTYVLHLYSAIISFILYLDIISLKFGLFSIVSFCIGFYYRLSGWAKALLVLQVLLWFVLFFILRADYMFLRSLL